eukprot:2824802-Rhodomonas_salina.1
MYCKSVIEALLTLPLLVVVAGTQVPHLAGRRGDPGTRRFRDTLVSSLPGTRVPVDNNFEPGKAGNKENAVGGATATGGHRMMC